VADERTAEVEVLWLDALQQVAGRAAHEIKGALNGVCVNLAVVRSRAAAQTAGPASGLTRFAEAASGQLEELVAMNEALLALTRRPRDVVDVAATAGHLMTLLAPVARSEGGSLEIVGLPTNGGGATTAPATAVRLVLATALLRALDKRAVATCRLDAADGMVIRLECADGTTIDMDPRVVQVATDAGIQVDTNGGGLSVAFPRAGRTSGRRSPPTREIA
jgi:hypothetical protein